MIQPFRIELKGNESEALKTVLEALDHLSRQVYLLHKAVVEIEPREPVHFETTCTYEGCEQPKMDSEHAFCAHHHNVVVDEIKANLKRTCDIPGCEKPSTGSVGLGRIWLCEEHALAASVAPTEKHEYISDSNLTIPSYEPRSLMGPPCCICGARPTTSLMATGYSAEGDYCKQHMPGPQIPAE